MADLAATSGGGIAVKSVGGQADNIYYLYALLSFLLASAATQLLFDRAVDAASEHLGDHSIWLIMGLLVVFFTLMYIHANRLIANQELSRQVIYTDTNSKQPLAIQGAVARTPYSRLAGALGMSNNNANGSAKETVTISRSQFNAMRQAALYQQQRL